MKYRDRETGFEVDVSFDVEGGMRTAALVKGFLQELPPMRPRGAARKPTAENFFPRRAVSYTHLTLPTKA